MRYTTTLILVTTLAVLIGTAPAMAANKASREEAIGVGSGAIIGAAAGGPVGFILGAAIGARIGDTMHTKNERLDRLQTSLDQSRGAVATLERDKDALGGEIQRLSNIARPELVDLMQAGIAMDLLFRTDEAALGDSTGNRLAQLASSLAAMPEIRIQLDGFADERGDEQYNLDLSEKRVNFVRDQFVAAGVDPTRIDIAAHGESPAQDDSIDSYALERRVSVKLFIEDAQSLASNPN